jgi:hypothetical protein
MYEDAFLVTGFALPCNWVLNKSLKGFKVQWSNAKHYRSKQTLTRNAEFSGMPHLLPAAPGWEEVADYVLAWALRNAR